MDEPLEIEQEGVGAPAWAAFGDLMAGVLGAFVLVLAANLFADAVRDALDPRTRVRGVA